MSDVGSIVFGPRTTPEERRFVGMPVLADGSRACFCVGPQPGEKKCPCVLAEESKMGQRMVRDGVTINGVHYDLVPREPTEALIEAGRLGVRMTRAAIEAEKADVTKEQIDELYRLRADFRKACVAIIKKEKK